MMIGKALPFGVAALLFANVAEARVTRIEITRHQLFAEGQEFGSAGSYEKLVGRFYGELDPAAVLNSGIVDLDKAPRNARGMVEYSSDFYILKPVDLSKGNGALFYDVNNRGNKLAPGPLGILEPHPAGGIPAGHRRAQQSRPMGVVSNQR